MMMQKMLVCLAIGVATATVAVADDHCGFDGKLHDPGTVVCMRGKQHKCVAGGWKSLGTTCARTGKVTPGVHAPQVKHTKVTHQPAAPVQPAPHAPTP
jgi:hypothetical protein